MSTGAAGARLAGRHVTAAIVGAGQAGLALSWHLCRAGVDHLLLERNRVAHEWRDGRWDNFTLVTPNWQCRLPGYAYEGPEPDGFMRRDAVYAWVQAYAQSFDPPVIEHCEVTGLAEAAGGTFTLTTPLGELAADHVVIATGGYHRPVIPPFASHLTQGVAQLHSSQYRNPGSLPGGAVLVVGSGQSGAQIAEDLHLEGRRVHLALGGAPRVARFYRGRDCVAWLHDMGRYDVGIAEHPGGLAKRESTNHYVTGRDGGRDIDLRAFAAQGMALHGRLVAGDGDGLRFAPTLASSLDSADAVAESIKDDIDAYIAREAIDAPEEARYVPVWQPPPDLPTELSLAEAGISAVVWAIGYRADYSWVRVGLFDGHGAPTHHRGVTRIPGLYFLGLPWLHTWGSGRFAGIARDAEYLAGRIVAAGAAGAGSRRLDLRAPVRVAAM